MPPFLSVTYRMAENDLTSNMTDSDRSALPQLTARLSLNYASSSYCSGLSTSTPASSPTDSRKFLSSSHVNQWCTVCERQPQALLSPRALEAETTGVTSTTSSGLYWTDRVDIPRHSPRVQTTVKRSRMGRTGNQLQQQQQQPPTLPQQQQRHKMANSNLDRFQTHPGALIEAHAQTGLNAASCTLTSMEIDPTGVMLAIGVPHPNPNSGRDPSVQARALCLRRQLVCDGCRHPICDQLYLCVGQMPWHVACLQCHVCGQNLQWEKTCFLRCGTVFCKTHYERMLHCLRCGGRFKENDSIYKIDAFFAYHCDCLQCASCARLLERGDAFVLNSGSVYCVTQRTHDDHVRSATCWHQVANAQTPLTRVFVPDDLRPTESGTKDSAQQELDRSVAETALPDPRACACVDMAFLAPRAADSMLGGPDRAEIQATVVFPPSEQSMRLTQETTDVTHSTNRMLTESGGFFDLCSPRDFSNSSVSDKLLPAVRDLISLPGDPADPMVLMSCATVDRESDATTQVPPGEIRSVSDDGHKSTGFELGSRTDSEFEFAVKPEGTECLTPTDSVSQEETPLTATDAKRSGSVFRDKKNRDSKGKRIRTSFKHQQLQMMKAFFELTRNPDSKDLKQLSAKTGLSKRVLQVWFQNARAKYRRTHHVFLQSSVLDPMPVSMPGQASPSSPVACMSQAECTDSQLIALRQQSNAESFRSDSSQPSISDMDNSFAIFASECNPVANQPLLLGSAASTPHMPWTLLSGTGDGGLSNAPDHNISINIPISTKSSTNTTSTATITSTNYTTTTTTAATATAISHVAATSFDLFNPSRFLSCGTSETDSIGIVGYNHGSVLSASFETASTSSPPPSQFYSIDELPDRTTFYLSQAELTDAAPMFFSGSKQTRGCAEVR